MRMFSPKDVRFRYGNYRIEIMEIDKTGKLVFRVTKRELSRVIIRTIKFNSEKERWTRSGRKGDFPPIYAPEQIVKKWHMPGFLVAPHKLSIEFNHYVGKCIVPWRYNLVRDCAIKTSRTTAFIILLIKKSPLLDEINIPFEMVEMILSFFDVLLLTF